MTTILLISIAILVIAFIYFAKIDMKVYKKYEESKRRLLICSTLSYKEYIANYKPSYKYNHTIMTFLIISIIVLIYYLIAHV